MGMFKTRGKGQVTNSSMSVNPSVRDDKTPWSRDGRYRFTFEVRLSVALGMICVLRRLWVGAIFGQENDLQADGSQVHPLTPG